MTELRYNNAKNANINYIFFELNCNYHSYMFFENETNPYSRFYFTDKLAKELNNLILISQQNIFYT